MKVTERGKQDKIKPKKYVLEFIYQFAYSINLPTLSICLLYQFGFAYY